MSAALLCAAVEYARPTVAGIDSAALTASTPCAGWDLRMLLTHVNDSLAALYEGIDRGRIGLFPPDSRPDEVDVVDTFGRRSWRLALACRLGPADATIGGCPISGDVLTGIGAIEIAVHGWDIARARRRPRPIPANLAEQLLGYAPVLGSAASRHRLFAPPRAVPAQAGPGDQLVAFLGRDP
jgi:uncharacterized protein (TIGR03086 family)